MIRIRRGTLMIGSSAFFLTLSFFTSTSAHERVYVRQADIIVATARVKQVGGNLLPLRPVRPNPVSTPVVVDVLEPQAPVYENTQILEFGVIRQGGARQLPYAHISLP